MRISDPKRFRVLLGVIRTLETKKASLENQLRELEQRVETELKELGEKAETELREVRAKARLRYRMLEIRYGGKENECIRLQDRIAALESTVRVVDEALEGLTDGRNDPIRGDSLERLASLKIAYEVERTFRERWTKANTTLIALEKIFKEKLEVEEGVKLTDLPDTALYAVKTLARYKRADAESRKRAEEQKEKHEATIGEKEGVIREQKERYENIIVERERTIAQIEREARREKGAKERALEEAREKEQKLQTDHGFFARQKGQLEERIRKLEERNKLLDETLKSTREEAQRSKEQHEGIIKLRDQELERQRNMYKDVRKSNIELGDQLEDKRQIIEAAKRDIDTTFGQAVGYEEQRIDDMKKRGVDEATIKSFENSKRGFIQAIDIDNLPEKIKYLLSDRLPKEIAYRAWAALKISELTSILAEVNNRVLTASKTVKGYEDKSKKVMEGAEKRILKPFNDSIEVQKKISGTDSLPERIKCFSDRLVEEALYRRRLAQEIINLTEERGSRVKELRKAIGVVDRVLEEDLREEKIGSAEYEKLIDTSLAEKVDYVIDRLGKNETTLEQVEKAANEILEEVREEAKELLREYEQKGDEEGVKRTKIYFDVISKFESAPIPDRVKGAMGLCKSTQRKFEAERDLLAHLEEKCEEQELIIAQLQENWIAEVAGRDLERTCEIISGLKAAESCHIFGYDSEKDSVFYVAGAYKKGYSGERLDKGALTKYLSKDVMATAISSKPKSTVADEESPIYSQLHMPLKADNKVIGVLSLLDKKDKEEAYTAFDASDLLTNSIEEAIASALKEHIDVSKQYRKDFP